MARPPRFDEDQILDAALDVLSERGARGVSVTAIAKRIGAPSGSLYHRFPSRDRLLAAMWLRSAARFQDGYLAALRGPDEPRQGLADAVAFVVGWCRARPAEGRLLTQYRREDLVDGPWPDEVAEPASRLTAQLDAAMAELAPQLGEPVLVRLAAISIPEGAVRPYLRAGQPVPGGLETAVVRASLAALGDRSTMPP